MKRKRLSEDIKIIQFYLIICLGININTFARMWAPRTLAYEKETSEEHILSNLV